MLAAGSGAEQRRRIGIVVFFGMTVDCLVSACAQRGIERSRRFLSEALR